MPGAQSVTSRLLLDLDADVGPQLRDQPPASSNGIFTPKPDRESATNTVPSVLLSAQMHSGSVTVLELR
ncbi:hypothetical protein ACFQ2B_21365 [Streptomyces stramineus]